MEKNKLMIFLIFAAIFIIVASVLSVLSDCKEKNSDFKGIVTMIVYNEKKTPIVTVGGKEYSLSVNQEFYEKIDIGDSLVKDSGYLHYKLIKRNKETFFSE